MKLLRDMKHGWVMARNADEVEFHGRCKCGNPECELWEFTFRGRTQQCREEFYDKLSFLAANKVSS